MHRMHWTRRAADESSSGRGARYLGIWFPEEPQRMPWPRFLDEVDANVTVFAEGALS